MASDRKRKAWPNEEEGTPKGKDMAGKHSDPATCNCGICVRSCELCQHNVAVRLHRYCKLCAEEVEACMRDAGANGWSEVAEELNKNPNTWKALMYDFSRQCPCHGPGQKRQKYDSSRASRTRESVIPERIVG